MKVWAYTHADWGGMLHHSAWEANCLWAQKAHDLEASEMIKSDRSGWGNVDLIPIPPLQVRYELCCQPKVVRRFH